MKKRILAKPILCLLLACSIFFTMVETTEAKVITTPTKSLSKSTDLPTYSVTVNGSKNRKLTYRVFSQSQLIWGKKSYVAVHGCAVCSLTTVLSGYSKKYTNYTPDMTYKILEKKVFGTSTWNRNYKQSLANQMPVSLYGISRILRYTGIKNTYVRKFTNASATRAIEKHLKTGRPVIIEVNNHTQVNGKFSSRYDQKWALSKHTMVLLGMTDTGKVIIADSATRAWSKTKQRVKFVKMSSLVRYMIPCSQTSNSCYYNSAASCGGYILVK